jgi:histone H3/H4
MTQQPAHFRLCSSCRTPLAFGARYYTCSVSTCNRAKMTLTFCSVPCFQAHVPTLRHRESWAEEKRAPTFEAWRAENVAREEDEREAAQRAHSHNAIAEERAATHTARDKERLERVASKQDPSADARVRSVERQAATATGKPAASKELSMSNEVPKEVLVVISKVKAYIRAKSSMNTSDAVTEALSELVRTTCDQAIERAKSEGRKTVMARDISGGTSPE